MTKFKIGLLAVIAGFVLALPGMVGIGGVRSALAADGDVCGIWTSHGAGSSTPAGMVAPKIAVGTHFYALARIQDNFKATFRLDFRGITVTTPAIEVDSIEIVSSDVVDFGIDWSIDGQTGEAKIIDRINDDDFVMDDWFDGVFGEAHDDAIPPINQTDAEILTEFAFEGGDSFANGDPADIADIITGLGDEGTLDIWEFFVSRGGTAADRLAATAALANCGSAFFSGFGVTDSNRFAVFGAVLACFFSEGQADDCEQLDELLGVEDATDDVDLSLQLDGWSEISVVCTKPGEVKISVDPTDENDFESEGRSLDVECIGPAQNATATVSPALVEIKPVGSSVSNALVVVTVVDANDKRLDGADVTFTTDKCSLTATAPASGVAKGIPGTSSLTTKSDTDTPLDLVFAAANSAPGDELGAGTAEAWLTCNVPGATPGTANIVWTIANATGSPAGVNSGSVKVTVVGPPATIQLAVSPSTGTCGTTMTATATVLDAAGQTVSDGTQVFFTTTTATGVQSSTGGQGVATTVGGKAEVVLSVDPLDAGTHTVSARTGGNDLAGDPVNAISANTSASCQLAAAAAPPVTAPRTGVGSITPPNTGDAGLASSSKSNSTVLFAIGAVAFALAGVATLKFARR